MDAPKAQHTGFPIDGYQRMVERRPVLCDGATLSADRSREHMEAHKQNETVMSVTYARNRS